MRFGQPFTGPAGLLAWHPRDVDVLREAVDAEEQAASEARFDAERKRILGMG